MSGKKPSKKAATNGSAAKEAMPVAAQHSPEKNRPSIGRVNDGKEISPEALEKISELRGKIQSSVGQVVLAMTNLPRYRNQTIGDLTHLVLEPLLRDRLAIASSRPKEGDKDEASVDTLAGIAIWASVSDEVEVKIREQIRAGAFPVRLSSEDWVSGEKIWLLDVIAPSRNLATKVLANFSQLAKDKPVAIHPIVARSVDPEILEKMKARPASSNYEKGKDQELTEDTETKGEA